LGIREKIIGGLGMMTAPPMNTSLLSNIYFCASSFVIKPTEKYKIFAKKYQEKYGKPITFDGVYTYDSGNVLYSNIRDNKNKISDFVNNTYQGISGNIFIDSDGGSHVDISLAYYNNEGKINELIIND